MVDRFVQAVLLMLRLEDIGLAQVSCSLETIFPVVSHALSVEFAFMSVARPIGFEVFLLLHHRDDIPVDIVNSWTFHDIVGVSIAGKTFLKILLFAFNQQMFDSQQFVPLLGTLMESCHEFIVLHLVGHCKLARFGLRRISGLGKETDPANRQVFFLVVSDLLRVG